ncbi:hypothetical protein KM043_018703 [Ampulex compressa]|nr:hypothetical protein KM043_018703 [Ampulex compressa]
MKDSTIITHADVYIEEMPGTSDGVIMSGDSPSSLQASLPQVGYDMPDEGQLGKITPTTPPTPGTPTNLKALEADTEKIEEAVAFVQTTFPSPEPRPRIEKNGIDLEIGITTKPIEEPDNDACLVNCLYFAQQFSG